jgi:hypothetical protein
VYVAPSTVSGEAVSDGICAICNTSAVLRLLRAPLDAPPLLELELLELLELLLEPLELLEAPAPLELELPLMTTV